MPVCLEMPGTARLRIIVMGKGTHCAKCKKPIAYTPKTDAFTYYCPDCGMEEIRKQLNIDSNIVTMAG